MLRYIVGFISVTILGGCSLDANIENMFSAAPVQGLPPGIVVPSRPIAGVLKDPEISDFKNSEIFVGLPGVSDGTTAVPILIRLMNSDQTVVMGYTPTVQLVKGTGVTALSCQPSDKFGFSVCEIKAHDSGVKTVQALLHGSDGVVELVKDVIFNAPTKEATLLAIGGGDLHEASSPRGWRMTGTTATTLDRLKTSKSGYKMFAGSLSAMHEQER